MRKLTPPSGMKKEWGIDEEDVDVQAMKFTWWPSSIWPYVAIALSMYVVVRDYQDHPPAPSGMCRVFGNGTTTHDLSKLVKCEPMTG